MTNDEKREQARILLSCKSSEHATHKDADIDAALKARAAALLREAEADENNCPACSRYRGVINGPKVIACPACGKPAGSFEAEAAPAPDVSEAERPKRLCDYDPVETTVGDMVMRFGFDYTNFKFFAESITKLTAALRAARKREGEAVDALESIRDEVLHAYANVLDNGQVNYVLGIIDSHIAARETAALNEGAKNG